MIDLLESKIKELEEDIEKSRNYLKETKESSKRVGESYYYDSFAEVYTELNKLQFALDLLEELQDEI